MASIRRGYSDDFVIKNNKVGIGTSNPQENLDVVGGALQGQDLKVTGISTQTAFSGFLRADHQIAENTEFSNINVSSLSGEIIVGTGVTVTIARVGLGTTMVGNGSGTIENTIDTTDITTAGGSQIDTLKVYNTFTPPSGDTNQRPYAPKPGELYYNYDFKTIEFFDGYGWRQVDNTTRSGRGIVGDTGTGNRYQYFNINTLGNTQDFGTWSTVNTGGAGNGGGSDGIRGVWSGGTQQTDGITIEYNTIASTGNFIDFGDLLDQSDSGGTVSSSTRAVICGAIHRTPLSGVNVMEYIEIQTLGNALDFGDIVTTGNSQCDGMNSPTRGFFEGGGYPTADNSINMITIASKGDAIDFGETTQPASYKRNVSSTTRGIACGGRISYPAGPFSDTIEYITMASTGNAIDFGNLTQARHSPAGAGTLTRGVFCGGYTFTTAPSTTSTNTMDYITIASTGDAIDFGDCSNADSFMHGTSDSHGGLGGF